MTTDPLNGLIGPVFGIGAGSRIAEQELSALGATPAARAAHVDAALTAFLNSACSGVDLQASFQALAAMRAPLRTLLALRFFALNAWDVCLAAENLQGGIEEVLGEDAYEHCADERDNCVDECGNAMDVLRDTLPAQAVFQAAFDALIANAEVPADASGHLEMMTDDILPELDWLFDIEEADGMDEDEEDDEDDEDDE